MRRPALEIMFLPCYRAGGAGERRRRVIGLEQVFCPIRYVVIAVVVTTAFQVARVAAAGTRPPPAAALDRQVRQDSAVALDARYAQEAREEEPSDAVGRAGPSSASASASPLRFPVAVAVTAAAAHLVADNAPSHVEDADATLVTVRLHEEQVQRVELRSRRAEKAGPALVPVLGLSVCQGSVIVTAVCKEVRVWGD